MPSDDLQLSLADLPPAQARRRAAKAKKAAPRSAPALANELPVARIAVDISLPHLDRLFDYAVTEKQSSTARQGARVRVRFAGQLVDGYIVERVAVSSHGGRLARLTSVVSGEPVLTPEIAALARTVADRYAGTMADVLRLALPPRHAAAEQESGPVPSPARQAAEDLRPVDPGVWQHYRNGPALIAALEDRRSPRAAWSAMPGVVDSEPAWTAAVAAALHAVRRSGRGAIVVVPDHRDVAVVTAALISAGIDVTALTAELGPRERYRRWISVLRGASQFVVGTRSTVYAPVLDLGLIVVWDDGDDLLAEPRAPYPHVREVAALRSHQAATGLLLGGYTRTAEVAALVERGFLESVAPDPSQLRNAAPRVRASGDGSSGNESMAAARLPSVALAVAREALRAGPVLIQVPRGGYVPRVVCARCRSRVQCQQCRGPVGLPAAGGQPVCQWCAAGTTAFRCSECGHDRLRATVVGKERTAEELGRAFPGVPVVTSGGADVLAGVDAVSAIVVSTPGAEPVAPGGYAAALLLDSWALLGRADLRADEEALRRWMAAAALVRSAASGGQVVLVADAATPAVQALIRWDPVGFAAQELAGRQTLGLPPARRFVLVTAAADVLADFRSATELPAGTEAFGPAVRPGRADEPVWAWVLAAAPRKDAELVSSLRDTLAQLTVRKRRVPRIHVDPSELAL